MKAWVYFFLLHISFTSQLLAQVDPSDGGQGSGGGQVDSKGKVLERRLNECLIPLDPIKLKSYIHVVEPILNEVSRASSEFIQLLKQGFQEKSWYLTTCPIKPSDQAKSPISDEIRQKARQDAHEIWFDKNWFESTDEAYSDVEIKQADIIIHELVENAYKKLQNDSLFQAGVSDLDYLRIRMVTRVLISSPLPSRDELQKRFFPPYFSLYFPTASDFMVGHLDKYKEKEGKYASVESQRAAFKTACASQISKNRNGIAGALGSLSLPNQTLCGILLETFLLLNNQEYRKFLDFLEMMDNQIFAYQEVIESRLRQEKQARLAQSWKEISSHFRTFVLISRASRAIYASNESTVVFRQDLESAIEEYARILAGLESVLGNEPILSLSAQNRLTPIPLKGGLPFEELVDQLKEHREKLSTFWLRLTYGDNNFLSKIL